MRVAPRDSMAPDEWRARGRRYAHRGYEVFYREEGEGPPILLLHGFPTSSWDWHRVWPALVPDHRVLAPDLIGYGFSAKPGSYDYSTADQADLVEGLLAERGIAGARVVAHDYGDTVVQELLARQARGRREGPRLEAVTFLNGGLFVERIRARPIQRLLLTPLARLILPFYGRGSFGRSFRPLFGPDHEPTESELDHFWSLVTRNDGKRVVPRLIRYLEERKRNRERWVGALRAAGVPLRFVCGLEDPVSGRPMLERYRELVPLPDTVALEGVGHFPQIEAPERVLEAVL